MSYPHTMKGILLFKTIIGNLICYWIDYHISQIFVCMVYGIGGGEIKKFFLQTKIIKPNEQQISYSFTGKLYII